MSVFARCHAGLEDGRPAGEGRRSCGESVCPADRASGGEADLGAEGGAGAQTTTDRSRRQAGAVRPSGQPAKTWIDLDGGGNLGFPPLMDQ
jgi:uncharacterized low-complexity protein